MFREHFNFISYKSQSQEIYVIGSSSVKCKVGQISINYCVNISERSLVCDLNLCRKSKVVFVNSWGATLHKKRKEKEKKMLLEIRFLSGLSQQWPLNNSDTEPKKKKTYSKLSQNRLQNITLKLCSLMKHIHKVKGF